jgi:uncharacterized protein
VTEGPFAHLEFSQWILAELAGLFLGLSKTSFSAISLLGIALMAQILPARESTGVILPMLVLGDVLAVGSFVRHTRWPEVFRLLPAVTLGILVGVLLFRVIPPPLFSRIIGIAVVLLTSLQVVLRLLSRQEPLAQTVTDASVLSGRGSRIASAWAFGVAAGVATMLANAAGPVLTIYLLAIGLPRFEFVGTGAWVFFLGNLVKIPFSAGLGLINPASLAFNLKLFPAVVVGVILGRYLLKVVSEQMFFWGLVGLTFAAGLRLIL